MKKQYHKKTMAGGGSKSYAPNGFIYEKILIESGLSKLGIDGSYEIVIADNPDIVESTAAEMLQKFLGKAGINVRIVSESKSTGKKRFLLGRDASLKAIARLGDSGDLKIRDVSVEDDGFHLKRIGDDVVVAGANPRGVLYGVYAFEDFISAGANGLLDIRKVPYFRKRMSAPGHYFNRVNFATEGLPEEKATYLSRIGANQVVLIDLGVGGGIPYCKLHTYVRSDIFTFQPSPSTVLQAKLKTAGAICKKYGIDLYFWFEEPATPGVAGGVDKYPPEALGMVKRPWGGGETGLEKTLCINSPIVQEHYKSMVKNFVREYPDVKGFVFYNLDGTSWLCTPKLCERCASVVKDSPHDLHTPWESQASFVTLLTQAARKERPDFDIRFWGSVHFNDSCEKLLRAAQGYGSLMCSWNGSDRDVFIPDNVAPDSSFDISLMVAKERQIPLYGMIEFNNLEAIAYGLPFPFSVINAIKRYKKQGLKHIMEFAGPIPVYNSINAIVAQSFLWNPDQNPEEFLADLSIRQFGEKAGKLIYRTWEEMKMAFDVWNDMELGPLSGSQMFLSLGTPAGIPKAILPDITKSYNYDLEIRTIVEPFRASDYRKFREKAFWEKFKLMNVHLAQAAEHAKKAIASADEKEFIGICYYEGASGRPTCKEYAELNYAPIAIADALCKQRCDILRACHLLTDIENARATGNKKMIQAQEKLYLDLIREDIGVQERFCELLTGFAEMRPCYMRTSLTEHEISDLLSGTREKIDKLKEFLKNWQPLSFGDIHQEI